MKNNKSIKYISSVLGVLSCAVMSQGHAALASNAVLNFDDGIQVCGLSADPSTIAGCQYDVVTTFASYFGMDTSGDGVIQEQEKVAMYNAGTGLTLGAAQASGDIDYAVNFGGAPWNHMTTQGLTIASALGGTAEIDMTGWNVYWQGGEIPWDKGGNAIINCETECLSGEFFTLDYSAVNQEPGVMQGFYYELHLEGVIASAVPVPAAVWLFGSGLIGLFGFSRRKANH